MNQTHYKELKSLCDEYGEYRKELVQYHSLLLRIAWCKLGKVVGKSFGIKKILDYLVLKLNKEERDEFKRLL